MGFWWYGISVFGPFGQQGQYWKKGLGQKYSYGLEGFVRVFGKLTTPSVMFLKQKTQILIAHQKEDIDRTQKSSLSRQKKFPMV